MGSSSHRAHACFAKDWLLSCCASQQSCQDHLSELPPRFLGPCSVHCCSWRASNTRIKPPSKAAKQEPVDWLSVLGGCGFRNRTLGLEDGEADSALDLPQGRHRARRPAPSNENEFSVTAGDLSLTFLSRWHSQAPDYRTLKNKLIWRLRQTRSSR